MDPKQLLKNNLEQVLEISRKHGAKDLRVFGSLARNEHNKDSDIDLSINYDPEQRSSWFRSGLILDLQELLGTKVDVVTENSLSRFKKQILTEAVPICDLINED